MKRLYEGTDIALIGVKQLAWLFVWRGQATLQSRRKRAVVEFKIMKVSVRRDRVVTDLTASR